MASLPARTTDLREANLSRQLPTITTAPPPVQPTLQASPPPAQSPAPAARPATTESGLIVDPNQLDPNISAENTLRGQRLGFGVEAGQVAAPTAVADVNAADTAGSIEQAFQSQQGALNQQFADEQERLAMNTSALGRTGIGTFNKERALITGRQGAARDALLGNLIFQSTQSDAQRALAAAQGNQQSGLAFQNLQANIAQSNVDRATDVDFARQAHLQNLQTREDSLARDAVQDQAVRASLLQQGFSGTPTGAIGNAAQTLTGGSQQFGDNASVLSQQAGGLTADVIQRLLSQQGGQ